MSDEIDNPACFLAGYCGGHLTAEEENILFRAAAEDQVLFDQLMEAEAIRDALSSAEQRERLGRALQAWSSPANNAEQLHPDRFDTKPLVPMATDVELTRIFAGSSRPDIREPFDDIPEPFAHVNLAPPPTGQLAGPKDDSAEKVTEPDRKLKVVFRILLWIGLIAVLVLLLAWGAHLLNAGNAARQ